MPRPAIVPEHEIIGILERALAAGAFGIAVKTSNPDALKRRIYTVRRRLLDMGDKRFRDLSLSVPHGVVDELWIIPSQTFNGVRNAQDPS